MQPLQHDGLLDVATGRSRRETSWRNKEMTWSALVDKLSETHRTAETHAVYLREKKPRQDEIKDVGGFVGGYLTGGRRKSGNVLRRQLVTLDLDFAVPGMWDDFTLFYGHAAALYSTHKHSPDAPRLRLIIPLSRPVAADEYVAIARRIAGWIGIEQFDTTTYQPERLMYWPSTSSDGVYVFEYQDEPWWDADEILSSYTDWRDSSEWPVSSKEDEIVQRNIKKQGDPLEKPGLIGAFCRTYSISEAIDTFLQEAYDTCDIDNRYSYRHGSTGGGLVVYDDDKFAFSHHGTDPVSNKLCNAFDLVRIHLYGIKDEDSQPGTPNNKLPSYVAMCEAAMKDSRVRMLLGAEKLADARDDFADGVEVELVEVTSDEWLAEMDVDRKGNYLSTINNVILVLENDPRLRKRLALDEFEKREVALRDLPWRKITYASRFLTDSDDSSIRHYLEKTYGITGIQKVGDAIKIALQRNGFHPVKDYLNGLEWDGESRVDRLLVEYLGAADIPYVHAVTRKTLVAAVARIFQPGVKFDHALTLVGAQGIGKSSLINRLGGKWFSDSLGDLKGKEPFEQIQGVWLVEMGELAGLKKADVETVKHFITKRDDRYRVAYGRRVENFPRQCVFFGTTNNRDFLRDPTGNRRFWPVDTHEIQPVKSVFEDLSEDEVGQVWAEAAHLYRLGESLHLSPEMEAEAAKAQADHVETDERTGAIEKYLDTLLPMTWDSMGVYERRAWLAGEEEIQANGTVVRMRVTVGEIWCEVLGGMPKDMTRYNTKDVHEMMASIKGWEKSKTKVRSALYGVQRGYVRTNTMLPTCDPFVANVANNVANN